MAYLRREGRITVPKEAKGMLRIRDGDLFECRLRKVR